MPIGTRTLDKEALDVIFGEARTHTVWQDRDVSDSLLKELWNIAVLGPTSANCCPMRVIFVKSREAKEKLLPALAEGNEEKTMTAPVTAIIGMDLEFYELLPKLFPFADARSWFAGNQRLIEETAMRNGSLQGAYFIIAARALGLDCGPMSGFDQDKVNDAFFKDTPIKSNFLCNLGYGDSSHLQPRAPRPEFDECCSIY